MTAAPINERTPVLWDLVEDSFEEAAFLWSSWQDGLSSHSRDLQALSFWTEERLQGCLEGVRLAGDAAFESLLAPALASDDRWKLVVAAHVAASGESAEARQVLTIIMVAARG